MSPGADERDAFDRGYLTAKVELLERKIDGLDAKVEALLTWRAWVLGAAAAVAAVVSVAVKPVMAWLRPGG